MSAAEPSFLDIATEAGVSKFTVSLALRNHPRVAPATRQRVLTAAEKLGYRPNPLVNVLMASIRRRRPANHRLTLALLISHDRPDWSGQHRYLQELRQGANARAEALGYGFDLITLSEANRRPRRLQQIIESRGIDGVIIAPLPHHGFALGLDWSRLAYVAVGLTFDETPAHRVCVNHYRTMRLALHACETRGWDRPGVVLHDRILGAVEDTLLASYLGYAFRRQGRVHIPPLLCAEDHLTGPMLAEWVRVHRVNAVLGVRGRLLPLLQEQGFRIGHDIGLAHLDCPGSSASLAGVIQHMDQVGAAAVDLLIEEIHSNHRGAPPLPKMVELEGCWHDGPSLPFRPVPV